MTQRQVTQEVVEADVKSSTIQRRSSQEIVETDLVAAVVQRQFSQVMVEADVVLVADAGVGIGPIPLPTTAIDIYNVQVKAILEMKHLRIENTSGSPVAVYVSVGSDAPATRWLSGYSIPANDAYDWEGWEIIPALGKIQAFAAVANVCNLYLDGVLQT